MINKWIVLIIALFAIWWMRSPTLISRKSKLLEEYDYVIVGAGSAGAIVAARLSEDPSVTVALLEAGPDNDEFPDTAIPLMYFLFQKTDIDWQYQTEPQEKSCWGLKNQRSSWPRGRVLGGTSSLNGMMAARGSRYDFDLWAEQGNKGWSYEDVLPYFKKMETASKDEWKASDYRGISGPVIVTEPMEFPEAITTILEASETQGLKTKDINGEDNIGMAATQANIGNGVRQSTALCYLKPAMNRPNLHVLTEAHTTKVIFDGKRAVGVEYVHKGRLRTVRCRKEVILSAGAIGSPQILLLSGVGPKEHLEEMKIPVIADLPVGKHLMDHIFTDGIAYTLEKKVSIVGDRIGLFDFLQYKLFGTGVLSATPLFSTGFSLSKHQPSHTKNPYLQYIVLGGSFEREPAVEKANLKEEVFEALYGGLTGQDAFSIMPTLLQPKSLGNIQLRTANPFDHPIIDPKYLTHQSDIDILIEGVRIGQRIMGSKPMEKLGAKRVIHHHPNCLDHTYDSDDYWECHIRSNTFTVYHPTSTCRMGPKGDPTAVVGPDLRVHGLEGLRVVDASIMPNITSGNTNFPSMMIGERGADLIRGK